MQFTVFVNGNQLVGGGGGDDGNLQFIRNGSDGDVAAGEVGAYDSADFLFFDELLVSADGVGGVALPSRPTISTGLPVCRRRR
jgi:hypothetical protein